MASTSQRERVRSSLERDIATGRWKPGELLPREQDLADRFSVSRNIIREAMRALQAEGLVEIQQGSGTRISSLALNWFGASLRVRMNISARGNLNDLRELLQVRWVLERGLAREVLRSLSSTAALRENVESMEGEASEGRFFADLDRRFHNILYEAIHNSVAYGLIDVFWMSFNTVDSLLPIPTYTPKECASWHRRILQAIDFGDALMYEAAMDAHFQGIYQRLQRADPRIDYNGVGSQQ